jgi:hypothetical protein
MKQFDLDWGNFLQWLPAWHALSVPARRRLLDTIKPSGSVTPRELGEHLPELVASGLVTTTPVRTLAAESAREFVRGVRAMDRHRELFSQPSVAGLTRYLEEHFTSEETYALGGAGRFGYAYGWVDRQRLAQEIAATDWVDGFLALRSKAEGKEWEEQRYRVGDRALLIGGDTFETTQRIVERLVPHPFGALLREVADLAAGAPFRTLGRSVHAALRYTLGFGFLDPATLEPRIGLWPPVAARLSQPPLEAPRAVDAVETFHAAVLMEDMTAVLVAAAGEPLRLRGNDYQIFARQQQAIAARLVAIPAWVLHELELEADERITLAADQLRIAKLAKVAGSEGRDLRLEASKRGTRWLALSDRERLASLLNPLRNSTDRNPSRWRSSEEAGFFPAAFGFELSATEHDLRSAVNEAFLSLPLTGFVPLQEFLDYHSRERNPFLGEKTSKPSPRLVSLYTSWQPTTRDGWERLWRASLQMFVHARLVALGGVRLGRAADGRLCFQLTEIGRYLLGAVDEFDYGHDVEGEVIVQPNFEVVFLARSPQLEAQLARIAARVGAGPGVMFRITRESILAAAEAGLGLDLVLRQLQQASSRDLPANVERQIRDWYAGVRRVNVRRALLIHCPDAETAARVRASAGNGLHPLTDTVLELDEADAQARKALLRKLRKVGVFVDGG